MKPLDRTDRTILTQLQNDTRVSNKELAAAADLAPSSCLARVRRLYDTGVIRGTRVDIDPKAAGVGLQALVAVQLSRHTRSVVDDFQAYVIKLEEVVQVFHVTGSSDYLVHIAVRDSEHLRDLTLSAFTSRPEVARIETSLLFAHYQNPSLPIYNVAP